MALPAENDIAVIQRVIAGEKEQFDQLFAAHRDFVYCVAYRICESAADAEEVVSETFYKAFKQLKNFRQESSFATWLYRIAVNESRDLLRKRNRVVLWDNTQVDIPQETKESESFDEAIIRNDEAKKLRQALLCLAIEDRLIMTFRYDRGLSYDEIAEILEMPRNTIGTRIFRAKKQLMNYLRKAGVER
ncbi:MAG: RNA polymerase sigma factor [Candidatus Saccharibacteria bacterium]